MASFQIIAPREPQILLGILKYLCRGNSEVLSAYGKRKSRRVDSFRLQLVAQDAEVLYRLYVNKVFLGAFPAPNRDLVREMNLDRLNEASTLLPSSLSLSVPDLGAMDITVSRQCGSLWQLHKTK